MKFNQIKIESVFELYKDISDLSREEQELLNKAKEACNDAYAPYSKFYVGSAVLLINGSIVTGNNQENAAYPSGLCAERVALFAASANQKNSAVKTLAIACKSASVIINTPVTPCGACRQVIAEYQEKYNHPIRILMTGEKGEVYACNGIEQLLPLMFNSKHLK